MGIGSLPGMFGANFDKTPAELLQTVLVGWAKVPLRKVAFSAPYECVVDMWSMPLSRTISMCVLARP